MINLLKKESFDISKRQADFLAWRKAYETTLNDLDNQNFDNPFEGLRSEESGHEFNWED